MKKALIVLLALTVVAIMIIGCNLTTKIEEVSKESEAPLSEASKESQSPPSQSPEAGEIEPSVPVDIKICKDLGLLIGGDNGVTAEDTATKPSRIQAAILLLRLKGLEADALAFDETDNFSDVTDDWMKPYTAYLKANPALGFSGNDGAFHPNQEITVEEYYNIMLNALGYVQKVDDAEQGDYGLKNVIAFAQNKGLSKVSDVTDFTIENLATATVEALKAVVKNANYTLLDGLVRAGKIDAEKAESALLNGNVLTLAQAQEDFKQFQTIMETYHPMVYTNKEEMAQLLETQYALLYDGMDTMELYRVLSPISAKINCGHTSIKFSKELENYLYQNGNYLPLSVKVIDNKAYVYQNISTSDISEGSEILSINDKKMEDIIKILLDNTNADGYSLAKKYWMINTPVSLYGNEWNGTRNGFSDLYFKYVERPESFSIEYKTEPESSAMETTVSAVTRLQYDEGITSVGGSIASDDLPTYIFEDDYAILTIKTFNYYTLETKNMFEAFLKDFFTQLSDKKISNLILDLRENRGGSPLSACDLFINFISEPTQYFVENTGIYNDIAFRDFASIENLNAPTEYAYHGKLYTLINGGSFSSSGHLCALMEYHNIGTFIGEETGGSYICTSGTSDVILKNSKLIFTCATVPWEAAVSGLTPGYGIMPDYEVVPTIQDYIDGKDVVKEFAIKLIKNGE